MHNCVLHTRVLINGVRGGCVRGDVIARARYSRNMPGAPFGGDAFMQMLELYDGDNEAEV